MLWSRKPVSIGLIGCGAMGEIHAHAIARHGGARLRCVFDPDRARAADLVRKHHGVRLAESLENVLADRDVEAVLIATPHNLHKPQTLAALQAGKHVLVEKPTALNHADACEMTEAARRYGLRLLVGQVMRFWPNVARAREAIAAGRIGDVRQVIRRRMMRQKDAGRAWAYDRKQAGGWIIQGNACHEVDAVLYMLDGQVARVEALATRNNPKWNDIDELAVLLALESGAICSLSQSLNCWPDGIDTVIIGTDATITLSEVRRGFAIDTDTTILGASDGFGEQIHDFVAAVREGTPSRIDAGNILETMRTLDRISEQLAEPEPCTQRAVHALA